MINVLEFPGFFVDMIKLLVVYFISITLRVFKIAFEKNFFEMKTPKLLSAVLCIIFSSLLPFLHSMDYRERFILLHS